MSYVLYPTSKGVTHRQSTGPSPPGKVRYGFSQISLYYPHTLYSDRSSNQLITIPASRSFELSGPAYLTTLLLSSIDPSNWVIDVDGSPDFEGVTREVDALGKETFSSIRANQTSHPHLKVDQTMTSAPKVNPGDMVSSSSARHNSY
jgi:hypothetical protein